MKFSELGLDTALLNALSNEGYEEPTPIQKQAIPHVLSGRDLLAIAQTGTGKTAAFALPILQQLSRNPRIAAPRTVRALILSPTRELCSQIADSFRTYGRFYSLSVSTIFGGVSEGPQRQNLQKGIDILVAAPGRLLDHLGQRNVDLSKTEIFVLDEADRMLDMGFVRDVRRLVSNLPRVRQSLFFSATMPNEIGVLASELLREPVSVEVTPPATTVERISQRVVHVEHGAKRALLVELLRQHDTMKRTLVFARTKHGADKIVRALDCAGIVSSALHGNKSQGQRVATMNAFRAGRIRVLVATDIAARGIDVDGISHVINFDLPNVAESYVHRIGRTARAGADGEAIALCAPDEKPLLRDIEKLTRQQIPSSQWKPAPGTTLQVPSERREETRDVRSKGPRREFSGRRSNEQREGFKPRGAKPHRKGQGAHHAVSRDSAPDVRGAAADRNGAVQHVRTDRDDRGSPEVREQRKGEQVRGAYSPGGDSKHPHKPAGNGKPFEKFGAGNKHRNPKPGAGKRFDGRPTDRQGQTGGQKLPKFLQRAR